MKTNNLGFPRIGAKRELKKAVESYWKGQISQSDLEAQAQEIRRQNWLTQQEAGIDFIPSNDFSLYDQILDTSCLFGVLPKRFNKTEGLIDLDDYFQIARGLRPGEEICCGSRASEMTKWFDTNYHYIVPELHDQTKIRLASTKIIDEFKEAFQLGVKTKPVLVGPTTFLSLAKCDEEGQSRFDYLDQLLPLYTEIFTQLAEAGCEWIQIDEPIFSLDLDNEQVAAITKSYEFFSRNNKGLKIIVANYFGELRDNKELYLNLPVDALHIDAIRGEQELLEVCKKIPQNKTLSIGILDGRNIWKNNYQKSLITISEALTKIPAEQIWLAPSCSLLHTPVTLASEEKIDKELKNCLAFATEKLYELQDIRKILLKDATALDALKANQQALSWRSQSSRIHNQAVKDACASLTARDSQRQSAFDQRRIAQQDKLQLPAFPTTTIGSLPQTSDVRRQRALLKKGSIDQVTYDEFIKKEINQSLRFQEECGIDLLVHGEFERNDMVEYFGEKLDGFAFTQFAWVQSYGSRCVKPPIIFGDVSRPEAMTLQWTSYAQTQTELPVKGMLTGPITILQWSFVRDDQPRSETAKQIALAVRDEVLDLEKSGVAAIQIDEPALREGLPLRRDDWQEYLDWSVEAFRLSTAVVQDVTQIHTHMCYCEFNDILDSVAALDADVISIETSRSNMELLDGFADYQYPNAIGPGVYDIHSPRVPKTAEMTDLLIKAKEVIPTENLWVNPDCGLKTRDWPEVKEALTNMVEAAKELRLA